MKDKYYNIPGCGKMIFPIDHRTVIDLAVAELNALLDRGQYKLCLALIAREHGFRAPGEPDQAYIEEAHSNATMAMLELIKNRAWDETPGNMLPAERGDVGFKAGMLFCLELLFRAIAGGKTTRDIEAECQSLHERVMNSFQRLV